MSRYKTILEITDNDFDSQYKTSDISKFALREATRGLVFNGDKIAIIAVTNHNFHKLPGGGIENGESIEEAFRREILEEVGCECQIEHAIGKIVEYRGQFQLKQTSYILSARVSGVIGKPALEPDEIKDGFELEWKLPEEVLIMLKKDQPTDYEGKFIVKRDLHVIEAYLNNRFQHRPLPPSH